MNNFELANSEPTIIDSAPIGFDQVREYIVHGKIETVEYYSKTVGNNRIIMVVLILS